MDDAKQRITLFINPDVAQKMKIYSASTGKPMSQIVEESVKLLPKIKNPVLKHKEFTIIAYSNGFEFVPGRLVRAAVFIVTNGESIIGFVFSDGGLLLRMAQPDLKDEVLLEKAINKIKEKIDTARLEDLEEYTFEYFPGNYVERNVIWWEKNLKKLYRKSE